MQFSSDKLQFYIITSQLLLSVNKLQWMFFFHFSSRLLRAMSFGILQNLRNLIFFLKIFLHFMILFLSWETLCFLMNTFMNTLTENWIFHLKTFAERKIHQKGKNSNEWEMFPPLSCDHNSSMRCGKRSAVNWVSFPIFISLFPSSYTVWCWLE